KPQEHPELEAAGPEADRARAVYCGPIGAEFMHIPFPDRCAWIAGRLESPAGDSDRHRILERLIEAETFERILQTRYVGAKRYSLEGSTALIPLLDEVVHAAISSGADQLLLAMSHR